MAATYVIKETNEPYSGLILYWSGQMRTTSTGAYEGIFSKELVAEGQGDSAASPNLNNRGSNQFTAPTNPRYVNPNGTLVPVGTSLVRNSDGSISLIGGTIVNLRSQRSPGGGAANPQGMNYGSIGRVTPTTQGGNSGTGGGTGGGGMTGGY